MQSATTPGSAETVVGTGLADPAGLADPPGWQPRRASQPAKQRRTVCRPGWASPRHWPAWPWPPRQWNACRWHWSRALGKRKPRQPAPAVRPGGSPGSSPGQLPGARNKYVATFRCRSYYGLHDHEDMASEPVPANPGQPPVFATGSYHEPRGGSRVMPFRHLPGAARRDTLTGGLHFRISVRWGVAQQAERRSPKPRHAQVRILSPLRALPAGLNLETSIA